MADGVLDCGHPETDHAHKAFTPGYGVDRDGRKHCYECCTARDLEHMEATGKLCAYLSSDGKSITNWPGAPLLTVTRETTGSAGGFARHTTITRVWARDRHGAWWHGRGPGRGMYIRMQRSRDNRAGRR